MLLIRWSIGSYGDGCRQKCNRCKNGAECHHVTGPYCIHPFCFSSINPEFSFFLQDNAGVCPDGKATTVRCRVRPIPGASPVPSDALVSTTAPAGQTTANAGATTDGWAPNATKVRLPSCSEFLNKPVVVDMLGSSSNDEKEKCPFWCWHLKSN